MGLLSERGLERRIKRHLRKSRHEYFAASAIGLEDILMAELSGLPNISRLRIVLGGVEFTGDLESMQYANLRLRTANRLLLRISSFLAQSYPMLYDHTKKVKWERYLGFRPDYSISISAKRSRLRHLRKIAETCEAAIADYTGDLGLSPSGSNASSFEFFVRLFRDRCSVSFNTSGEHLHRRGYRKRIGVAPIRETLAAAVLKLANFDHYSIVVDPFCGSGTMLIEAAHMASGQYPGTNRHFSFQDAPYHRPASWQRIADEPQSLTNTRIHFVGSDISSTEVAHAVSNAHSANVEALCMFSVHDARLLNAPRHSGKALIISNLPYGKRVSIDSSLLSSFASHLEREFSGWDYAFLTRHPAIFNSGKFVPKNTVQLTNGGLPVSYVTGTIL